jgi:hypothetical protein
MAGFGIGIKIEGDEKFMKKLATLGTVLLDFKEGLDDAGKNLTAYFAGQVFASQGGVFGTPWQSLAASTQAYKQKHYAQYSAVPLMATGNMQGSFVHAATPLHLQVNNTAPYFVYHQSTAARSKIPRRAMFAINDDVKSIIRQAIEKAMIAKLAGL